MYQPYQPSTSSYSGVDTNVDNSDCYVPQCLVLNQQDQQAQQPKETTNVTAATAMEVSSSTDIQHNVIVWCGDNVLKNVLYQIQHIFTPLLYKNKTLDIILIQNSGGHDTDVQQNNIKSTDKLPIIEAIGYHHNDDILMINEGTHYRYAFTSEHGINYTIITRDIVTKIIVIRHTGCIIFGCLYKDHYYFITKVCRTLLQLCLKKHFDAYRQFSWTIYGFFPLAKHFTDELPTDDEYYVFRKNYYIVSPLKLNIKYKVSVMGHHLPIKIQICPPAAKINLACNMVSYNMKDIKINEMAAIKMLFMDKSFETYRYKYNIMALQNCPPSNSNITIEVPIVHDERVQSKLTLDVHETDIAHIQSFTLHTKSTILNLSIAMSLRNNNHEIQSLYVLEGPIFGIQFTHYYVFNVYTNSIDAAIEQMIRIKDKFKSSPWIIVGYFDKCAYNVIDNYFKVNNVTDIKTIHVNMDLYSFAITNMVYDDTVASNIKCLNSPYEAVLLEH